MGAGALTVKRFYDLLEGGDAPGALGLLAPDILWREAENFPYADKSPYIGPEAVVAGVFARLGTEWTGFRVAVEEILDAGEKVVVLGRYRGVFTATGKSIDAQLVHVWTVANGTLTGFQQHVDTLQVAEAVRG